MEMPLSRYRAPLLTALPVLACLLLTATHAVAQPDPPPVNTAQSEIEQLIDVLEGRWKTHVFYEPNPQMPDGGTSVGWEESRAGPGRASIIIETESHGASGSFEGAGFVTWDVAHSRYNLHWMSTSSPHPGFFTGRWSGGNVVFDGYEYVAEDRFASRHSITEIRADAFVYTIDMGSTPDHLMRTATIHYTRA
jgi:hypothetical protein